MTKRLLHFITLLFVMLTTMSLNVAADTYSVAPSQLQPKVTVTPSDEYVNVPIRLTNWGTNPVSQITYTLFDPDTNETSEPINMDFETPFADNLDVNIPIKPGTKIGESDVTLNITHVDGHFNEVTIPYTMINAAQCCRLPRSALSLRMSLVCGASTVRAASPLWSIWSASIRTTLSASPSTTTQ